MTSSSVAFGNTGNTCPTCPHCGSLMPYGQSHSCATLPMGTTRLDQSFAYLGALNRCVAALERIAAALEGLSMDSGAKPSKEKAA